MSAQAREQSHNPMNLDVVDNRTPSGGGVSTWPGVLVPDALGGQTVSVIGAASGLGARDRGCELGPDVLRRFGLEGALREDGIAAAWADIVRRPAAGRRAAGASAIQGFCEDLGECVSTVLRHQQRFVVVGGDHSCAIGTWSAASSAFDKQGPLGLVWVDAHMDSHTPATSPSGAVHGMPLACLLGEGAPRLTRLVRPGPKLLPRHICLVGVRSFEDEEAKLLKRLGVRVIFMDEVRRHGISAAMQRALEHVCEGTSAFGVSIDLDAVDPRDAPGVGTPVAEGLRGKELVDSMALVAKQPGLVGIEIAELNPLHDKQDSTARLVCELLRAGLAGIEHHASHR